MSLSSVTGGWVRSAGTEWVNTMPMLSSKSTTTAEVSLWLFGSDSLRISSSLPANCNSHPAIAPGPRITGNSVLNSNPPNSL